MESSISIVTDPETGAQTLVTVGSAKAGDCIAPGFVVLGDSRWFSSRPITAAERVTITGCDKPEFNVTDAPLLKP